MKYSLRLADESDFEKIHGWRAEAYRPYVERWYGEWDEAWQRQHLRDDWMARARHVIVVEGHEVGVVDFVEEPDVLLIGNVIVVPGWRGRGIGTAVIQDLLRTAETTGSEARLQVFKDNPAVRLYERLGFEVRSQTESQLWMHRTAM